MTLNSCVKVLYSLGIMPSFWKLQSRCTSSGKGGQAQLSLSQGSFRGEYNSISWGSHYASDSMSLPLASHLWVTQEERDVLLSAGRFPRVLPSQSSFRLDAACISFCLLVSGDQQCFAGGGITQRAKEHHLEVGGQLVHGARHQRRLADASHLQHAHYPATLLQHPLDQKNQFRLSPVEVRHGQRLAPLYPWPTRSRSADGLSARGLLA